jgi:hypothetical protein
MIYKLRKIEGCRWGWGWGGIFLCSDCFVILIETKTLTVVICSIEFPRSFTAMPSKWNSVIV